MSNVRKPIEVPRGTEPTLQDGSIRVQGPKGELQRDDIPDVLEVAFDQSTRLMRVDCRRNDRRSRALHGLFRSLIANMVEGVSKGFEQPMEIYGTGYSVNLQGRNLVFQIGFCHPVTMELPEGMEAEIQQNTAQPDNPARFVVRGADKQVLGQFAAEVRAKRPPEPYKGKGIRYTGEYVRRKEGKAFAGGA